MGINHSTWQMFSALKRADMLEIYLAFCWDVCTSAVKIERRRPFWASSTSTTNVERIKRSLVAIGFVADVVRGIRPY